jgi:hypothetical protein
MFASVVATALIGMAAARDITLAWDPNSEPDVTGYFVSMGANDGGPYPQRWPIAGRLNTQLVVSNLGPGRYYFVAQAVNASNLVSDFSNQVEAPSPTPPQLVIVEPPVIRLTGVVYRATNTLGPWTEFCRLPPVEVQLVGELGLFRLGLEWSPVGNEESQ